MPVRNCSVIRKRVVVPNAYVHAPLFGAGWFRKRASPEIAPVRSSTQPATNRPASAVRDPILPIALIASTSSPVPWGLRRPSLGSQPSAFAPAFDPGFAATAVPASFGAPTETPSASSGVAEALRASVLEEGQLELLQARRVGEYVDLDDLPYPDRETHYRKRPSSRSHHHSRGSVHHRGRQRGRRRRPPAGGRDRRREKWLLPAPGSGRGWRAASWRPGSASRCERSPRRAQSTCRGGRRRAALGG